MITPKIFRRLVLLVTVSVMGNSIGLAQVADTTQSSLSKDSLQQNSDTTFRPNQLDSLTKGSGPALLLDRFSVTRPVYKNQVNMWVVGQQPFSSLQQILKGNVAGLYAPESTGEPGSQQPLFVRGLSAPLLTELDLASTQPVVYINGLPMVVNNSFITNLQRYPFAILGTGTNLYDLANSNNIESIEVIKDPGLLGKLGPVAANGAIWIITKNARSGHREMEVNAYYGVALKPEVTPINGVWENRFRMPFYNRFGSTANLLNFPAYLRDSSDINYYGPANWVDSYYKNRPYHSVDMSLTGGTSRANFRFVASTTQSVGVEDGTGLKKYGMAFFINMAPLPWFTVSAMMNGNRLERERNKNIRDRLAETGYKPDLSNPLPPNNQTYGGVFLAAYKKGVDGNKTNSLQGYVSGAINFPSFKFVSKIGYDFNEGMRDLFWPTNLMEHINYSSSYYDYNQRLQISNTANYTWELSRQNQLDIEAGHTLQKDRHKYDYAQSYNSLSDFIKINKDTTNGLNPYLFRYSDRIGSALSSLYGKVTYYGFEKSLNLSALVRYDGTSNMPADHRWLLTPVFSAGYDFKLNPSAALSALSASASWGRFGKLLEDDRFAAGPQYRVELGWAGESVMGSYGGRPGLSRPYTGGWVGYGYGWPISDKWQAGLNIGLLQNRVLFSIDWYNTADKNQILRVDAPSETGYAYSYKNGLQVNNTGLDVTLAAEIFKRTNGFNWTFNAHINKNANQIKALPENAKSLIVGDTKLEVGMPADAFWVYENKGIYNNENEIPINGNSGKKITFNGVPFSVGDAIWKDQNGDGVINSNDKVLKGHYLPTMSGGFGSQLSYKRFGFNFQFYYALGRKVLNQQIATRFDFINEETNNSIGSVKEITFWKKYFDPADYPQYNPWSDIKPYRVDQDLFLQDASFLKLRSLSLSYDFSQIGWFHSKQFKNALLYLSASNVFTLSPFKNGDPELSLYNGVYNGYGITIPKSFTVGLKLNF